MSAGRTSHWVVRTLAVGMCAGLLAVPSAAMAADDEEYIAAPPRGGNENKGGGSGSDTGKFAVPGIPEDKPAAPDEVSTAPAPPEPDTSQQPTQADIDAAKAAKLEQKRERKKLEKKAFEQAVITAVGLAEQPSTAPEPAERTETAAEVARTAFEDDGAGPLPMVIGLLLVVTGLGLVVRYRRTST